MRIKIFVKTNFKTCCYSFSRLETLKLSSFTMVSTPLNRYIKLTAKIEKLSFNLIIYEKKITLEKIFS